MLKVRVRIKEDEPPLVYDNIENIYIYPEPEEITGIYISLQSRDINNHRYYSYIRVKYISVLVEEMPKLINKKERK